MSLNKLEFRMAILTVTREYIPGFSHKSRKPMRFPPGPEMRLNSPALGAEQFCVPDQTCKEPRFADGTRESPPQHPDRSQRTVMSPQECEIAWYSPNQLEIMPDSPALVPEQFPVPHHTRQVA